VVQYLLKNSSTVVGLTPRQNQFSTGATTNSPSQHTILKQYSTGTPSAWTHHIRRRNTTYLPISSRSASCALVLRRASILLLCPTIKRPMV